MEDETMSYGIAFEREIRPREDGYLELGLVGFALPHVVLPPDPSEHVLQRGHSVLNEHLARHAVVHYEARAYDLTGVPDEEL